MESVVALIGNFLYEGASLMIAAGALIYAVLAHRVATKALAAAEESDSATLKLKAQEGRARAERSFLSLQAACREMRRRWDLHQDRHYPILTLQDIHRDDMRHILEVESEGRKLLGTLKLEVGALSSDDLEGYIQRADQTAVDIERLTFRLSPPKELFI